MNDLNDQLIEALQGGGRMTINVPQGDYLLSSDQAEKSTSPAELAPYAPQRSQGAPILGGVREMVRQEIEKATSSIISDEEGAELPANKMTTILSKGHMKNNDVFVEMKTLTSVDMFPAPFGKIPDFFIKTLPDHEEIRQIRNELSHIPLKPLPREVFVDATAPISLLPKEIEQFISAGSQELGVSPEMILPGVLAVALAASRGCFDVAVNERWVESLVEYFAVSSLSGDKKSPVCSMILAPLADEEARLIEEFNDKKDDVSLMARQSIVKNMQSNAIRKYKKLFYKYGDLDLVSKEMEDELEIISHMKNQNKLRRTPKRLLADIATPEGLSVSLAEQDEFLAIIQPEGSHLKRINSTSDELLLKAYNSEPFSAVTKTLGSVYLTSPSMVICVYAQPKIVNDFYADDDLLEHGLLARYLPVFITEMAGGQVPLPGALSLDTANQYAEKIRQILVIPCPKDRDGRRVRHHLEMDMSAKNYFDVFSREVEQRKAAGGFHWSPAFGRKFCGHAVRLAGAVHLFKHDQPHLRKIDEETMRAGIELAEFFGCHAAAAFDQNGRNDLVYARKILEHLQRRKDREFSERDAQRWIGSNAQRGHSLEKIRRGIDLLERYGYLRRLYKIGGDRTINIVNPSICDTIF